MALRVSRWWLQPTALQSFVLPETVVFPRAKGGLVPFFIACYRNFARTALVGRIRYSMVIPLIYRVEVVTSEFGTAT